MGNNDVVKSKLVVAFLHLREVLKKAQFKAISYYTVFNESYEPHYLLPT
jgi:hypothetical protein